MKKIFHNSFSSVLFGRIISTGLQSLLYIILASILDTNSYGELSYIIALAGTFSIFSRFGLNHTITVMLSKGDFKTSSSINGIVIITTSFASFILVFINPLAAILCFAMSVFLMTIHNLLGLKRYKTYMHIDILKGVLIISVPLGFYYVMDFPGVLLGMSISYLICSFQFFKSLTINIKSFTNIRDKIHVIVHNFGVDFSIHGPKFLDKLVIFPLLGYAYVGIYQLNTQILFGLEMLPLALHSFLLSEESSRQTHKKTIYLAIIASCFIAIFVILMGPYFINEFFEEYSDGVESLQVLIIAIIPLTISSIINAKLQAQESTVVGYSAIVRIGILLILIAVLGPIIGLMGLALAVLFSTISYTIFLYIMFKKSSA